MPRTPTVLTLVEYYLPGHRAGGVLRSICNLVDRLGDEFQFRLITRDRDCFAPAPYADVAVDRWQRVGRAEVFYASPRSLTTSALRTLLAATPHDLLYLNSVFSPPFTLQVLLLRRLGLIPRLPAIIAPKGEVTAGALAIKRLKKRAWLTVGRGVGLYDDLVWQASSPYEVQDIRACFPPRHGDLAVHVAPDLPSLSPVPHGRAPKHGGELRVVFVSRIAPKKNLHGALALLAAAGVPLAFDVYGPIEDAQYWAECKRLIASMPAGVRVAYKGVLEHRAVPPTLAAYDLFFLPTCSENFGHVVLEALSAGCPVLLSDRTPWRGLEQLGVGWDVSLDDADRFRNALECCRQMGEREHAEMREAGRAYAARLQGDPTALELNRRLFHQCLAGPADAERSVA